MLRCVCPWVRVKPCPWDSSHSSFWKIHLKLIKCYVRIFLKMCSFPGVAVLCSSTAEGSQIYYHYCSYYYYRPLGLSLCTERDSQTVLCRQNYWSSAWCHFSPWPCDCHGPALNPVLSIHVCTVISIMMYNQSLGRSYLWGSSKDSRSQHRCLGENSNSANKSAKRMTGQPWLFLSVSPAICNYIYGPMCHTI
jgi:hypothetical protein